MTRPRSALSGVVWPAVPSAAGAQLLALQQQFQTSEWLAPEELAQRQFAALRRVLDHACRTVPYYRDQPAYGDAAGPSVLDAHAWQRLPVLSRADVQDAGGSLVSHAVPERHLPVSARITSGSTGQPVRALATRATGLLWQAVTLRDHLWHGRDATRKLCAIRAEGSDRLPPEGVVANGWGAPIDNAFPSGRTARLGITNPVPHQAAWLAGHDPDYLVSLPSNLVALARHCQADGVALPHLRAVVTYGEMVTDDVRSACRAAWGVEVQDVYSTQEVGYLALQCPVSQHYHEQAETVLVEVLDDAGLPCRPGQVGRVVVSPLHNYAMPLLRYEVGDYAQVGGPCPCGRGLGVLTRVVGRRRNMLRLPTGEGIWPRFPAEQWAHIGPIRQLQLVQRDLDHLEVRVVSPRPLTAGEEAEMTAVLRRLLTYPFAVSFSYLSGIDRSRERKFDDFVSLV